MNIETAGPGAGVLNWNVDGVNNLGYQGFYFRVGGVGPESMVQSISAPGAVSFVQIPNVLSRLDVTYANASYSVRTVFQLTGGNPGSGYSGLSETITVKNLSGAPLDFHLFQYSDFNLFGLAGGQVSQFDFDLLGQPYKVTQTAGASHAVTEIVNASSAPVGHYEANMGGLTLASLTDGFATTLNDSALSGPPGDATFAYQWDKLLQPNDTIMISKLIVVPEPTTGSLILLALASGLVMRRRK